MRTPRPVVAECSGTHGSNIAGEEDGARRHWRVSGALRPSRGGKLEDGTDRTEETPGASEPAEAMPDSGPAEAATESEAAAEVEAAEPAAAAAEAEPAEATADAPRRPRTPRAKPRDPALARAFRSHRPVQGRVVGVIKGGYEVRLGRSRAFCPHSQIALHRVENAEEMVGKSFLFRVSQFRRGGEDVVVSRRAMLEEERADEAKAVRAALLEGAVVQGRVSGVANFGAFIDLGAGVMGLVHISELSHSRVSRVQDAVKVGDLVAVRILRLDGKRISLSLRQASEDPWQKVAETIRPGAVVSGTVLRLADFGAFIELAPDIQALAPAREFPPSTDGWSVGLEPGKQGQWLVLSVDPAERRIAVAPAPEDPAAAQLELEQGAKLTGRVQRVEKFGVFVWLAPGKVGLMPAALSGTPRNTDLAREFPIGRPLEVEVLEVDEAGRRIRLSSPGQAAKAAREEGARGRGRGPGRSRESRRRQEREVASPQSGEPQGTFGTALADKLRAALDRAK